LAWSVAARAECAAFAEVGAGVPGPGSVAGRGRVALLLRTVARNSLVRSPDARARVSSAPDTRRHRARAVPGGGGEGL